MAEYVLYFKAKDLLVKIYLEDKDDFACLSKEELLLEILKIKSYRLSRKTKSILDEIPKNILKELMPILTANQKAAFCLYHGENLDNVWPDHMKNQERSKAALYQSYEESTKKIRIYYKKILKKLNITTPSLENEEKIIEEIRKSFHSIIFEIPRDILFFFLSFCFITNFFHNV